MSYVLMQIIVYNFNKDTCTSLNLCSYVSQYFKSMGKNMKKLYQNDYLYYKNLVILTLKNT